MRFQTVRNFAIRTCNSEQRDKNGSCGVRLRHQSCDGGCWESLPRSDVE